MNGITNIYHRASTMYKMYSAKGGEKKDSTASFFHLKSKYLVISHKNWRNVERAWVDEFEPLGIDPILCNLGQDTSLYASVCSSLRKGRARACSGIARVMLPDDLYAWFIFCLVYNPEVWVFFSFR